MKQARTKPPLTRYADKPLKDWSNADLVEWAQEKCDDVVPFLATYDGLDLAYWKKEDFEEYLGGGIGAALYNCLECAPSAPPSMSTHTTTDAGLLAPHLGTAQHY